MPFSKTCTAISLPQSLDSSTARINELALLPLSLAIQQILMLAKRGCLPKILLKLQDKLPLCVACQFGNSHHCPWCTKGKKKWLYSKAGSNKPGDRVSVDQIISAQPGLIPQMAGFLTRNDDGDAPHLLITSAIAYMSTS